VKNYGSPDGIPIEEAMQAYLNDHLGEHAPRIGTATGESIGFNVVEWWPDGNVWEAIMLAADSIGYGLVFDWIDGNPRLILVQNRSGRDVHDITKIVNIGDKPREYTLVAKRKGSERKGESHERSVYR